MWLKIGQFRGENEMAKINPKTAVTKVNMVVMDSTTIRVDLFWAKKELTGLIIKRTEC